MGNAQRLAAVVERVLGGPLPVGLRAWDGSRAGPPGDPTVVLHRRRALWHLASRPGELGLARAYVSGDLDVSGDLKEGLRRCWAAARSGSLRPPRLRVPWPGRRSAQEARLRGRLHAPGRDRAAIAHHYDLGNEFYRLILDDSMAYSCGYWRSAGDGYGLADAQHDKLELICRKLALRPGMRLLDVGCGWGSLVLHAARHHGVHATGITISAQQREFVTARVAELGLSSLVDVRLTDYREFGRVDPVEPFDAVASVEMGEHVGEANYPAYAATLRRLLRPGGRLLLQQMSRGAVAPGGGAFIESYIAPDMTMRPLSATLGHLSEAGLEVRDVEAIREHYVRTIDAWAATLEDRWDEVVATVGVGWARVWRLYLVGGALAFEEDRMGVDQILAVPRVTGGHSAMPATRDWLGAVAG